MVIFRNRSATVKLTSRPIKTILNYATLYPNVNFNFLGYRLGLPPSTPPLEQVTITNSATVTAPVAGRLTGLVSMLDSMTMPFGYTNSVHGWEAVQPQPIQPVRDHYSESAVAQDSVDLDFVRLHSQGIDSSLPDYITALPPASDLTITSQVDGPDGEDLNIPMMDFNCDPTPANMESIATGLRDLNVKPGEYRFFNSGRSLHLYGMTLLDTPEWHSFMGKSLLLNRALQSNLSDGRWIGHSLVKGFSALRITCVQTNFYSQPPKFVGYFDV